MSQSKKPHPRIDTARTLRCSGCRRLREFQAMETNVAECSRCKMEMVFQIPDLDVSVPLNRGDMVLIYKLFVSAYCNRGLKNPDESEHIWAHRLMREFRRLNPTDLPLDHEIKMNNDDFIEVLMKIFGADTVKFINLDDE